LAVGQETALRAYDVIARLGPGHRLHFVATGLAFVLAYFLDGEWPVLADATARYAISADTARSPVGIMAAAFAALSSGRAGDPAAARAMLEHFTSAVDHMAPRTYTQVTSVPIAATAVWDLEAAELAATYRRLVLNMLTAGVGDHLFGPLELWVARMSALSGDDRDAEDNFELARRKLDARGLTHVRGIVDYDQARTQLRSGSSDRVRIAELLDAAADAFRAHGMLGWAERAALQKEQLTIAPAVSTGRAPRAGKSRSSDRPAGLTARELEVLGLVAAGLTNKEIAARLVLSVATVERHIANIYGKIGAGRRYDAIAFARSHDLGPDPEGHS
jgi:ATP/maltotriose-dependent transcriptional regulator MalT